MSCGHDSEIYAWFENAGIISNVRTHLRQNLVNALKNKVSHVSEHIPRSAKQYVYDLLIADYLLRYNYAYTLSVLASEAPLLINFQKDTQTSVSDTVKNDKHTLPGDYICHALQTLGISPEDTTGRQIVTRYANDNMPLILCILLCLTRKPSNESPRGANGTCVHNQQVQTDDLKSSISQESISLLEAKKKLYQQKELFSTQLESKESELRQQAVAMEQQLGLLNDRLQQAQNFMLSIDLKQKQLAEENYKKNQSLVRKDLELSVKERQLSLEADRLQRERDSYRRFEEDMKKLREELAKVRSDLPSRNLDSGVLIKQSASIQTDELGNHSVLRDLDQLNQEKRDLTSLVREQQSRIEELTLRVVTLSRRLEEVSLLRPVTVEPGDKIRPLKVHSIFSESSSTEDILQDAKMRLKRLENESLRADQYFYNCITSP